LNQHNLHLSQRENITIKKNNILLKLALASFAIIAIVNSCRKDTKQSAQSSTRALINHKVNIGMLPSFYNKGVTESKQKQTM
jgi:hypothetical protein